MRIFWYKFLYVYFFMSWYQLIIKKNFINYKTKIVESKKQSNIIIIIEQYLTFYKIYSNETFRIDQT